MKVQVVGINHTTAPVSVRERVGFTPDALKAAYQAEPMSRDLAGLTIISTCNRTELYVAGQLTLSEILHWWGKQVGVERHELTNSLYWYEDDAALSHLFRVAAGLDSMILGETQILGQVKDAYLTAHAYDRVGSLHRVFHAALKVGKRARAETGVGKNALSMGHAVVELAEKVFGGLTNRTVLLVGAGEMAQLAGRHLREAAAGHIVIANRSEERARELADELGAEVSSLSQLSRWVAESDIVVASAGTTRPLISEAMCRLAFKGQRDRLRFFFDLGVPRNIDPAIAQISSSIFVYNIDDIKAVVAKNRSQREKEALKVERIINEEREVLKESLAAGEVGPLIRSLREKVEQIRHSELDRAFNKLPELSAGQRAIVEQATRLMLNRLLNDAMVSIRRWGNEENKQLYLDAIAELFQLSPAEAQPERTILGERLELVKPEG